MDCAPRPSSDAVGMSNAMPLNCGSIRGTGGGDSSLSNSVDLLPLKVGHFRSDHRDPGREPGLEPGRELGRDPASLTTMLGILRKERKLTVEGSASCSDVIPLDFAKTGGASLGSGFVACCVGVLGAD